MKKNQIVSEMKKNQIVSEILEKFWIEFQKNNEGIFSIFYIFSIFSINR
jgi:hypothetical protein